MYLAEKTANSFKKVIIQSSVPSQIRTSTPPLASFTLADCIDGEMKTQVSRVKSIAGKVN